MFNYLKSINLPTSRPGFEVKRFNNTLTVTFEEEGVSILKLKIRFLQVLKFNSYNNK